MKKLFTLIMFICALCCAGTLIACDAQADVTDPCADGHIATIDKAQPPTCTQAGLSEGAHCSVCQKVLSVQNAVPATGHSAGEWTLQSAATCTQNGARYTACTVCNTVLNTESTEKIGHNFSTWNTTKAASCTQKGEKESTCTHCGTTVEESIDELAHSEVWINDLAASCTTDGKRHSECRICRVILETQPITAFGHDLPDVSENGKWLTLYEASCTAQGLKKAACAYCDLVIFEAIPISQHTESEWIIDTNPTCTTGGAQHKICLQCKSITTTQPLPMLTHQWTELVVPATCQSPGSIITSCTRCQDAKTQSIEPIAHKESTWITDTAPTCTTPGKQHKECTMCGIPLGDASILPELGHLRESWSVLIPPTCLLEGEEIRRCTRCGDCESRPVATVAHTISDTWIVDTNATCRTQGLRHKECESCHSIFSSEIIPMLAHLPLWSVTSAPTATTTGISAKRCTTCNEVLESAITRLEYASIITFVPSVRISLGDYSVVYRPADNASQAFTEHLNRFCTLLRTTSGKSISQVTDEFPAQDKEILIGLTNRAESNQALAELSGNAFTVRVIGEKIVILGTSEALTLTALQYFINENLGGTATIDLSIRAQADDLDAKPLANATGTEFVFVKDKDLDTDPHHMYASGITNNRDYPVVLFEDLLSQISSRNALSFSALPTTTDDVLDFVGGYEVLFGEVERAESRAFRNGLLANEYGFAILEKKLVITSHTDIGLQKALDAFLSFYDYLLSNNDGLLPQNYVFVGAVTDQGWIVDFPTPDCVSILNAQHNNDNSIQIIYTGQNTDATAYLAYCQKLEAAGYTLLQSNDNPGNTGNYFRIYQNSSTQHALYVAYNAFGAQSDYASNFAAEEQLLTQYEDFIHYGSPDGYTVCYRMYTYEPCIRVISAPLATAYLPDSSLLTQQEYVKLTTSSITTIRSASLGMGYILQLENGSFIIVDGGNDVAGNMDKEILYSILTELHTQAYGTAPCASTPIRIAAWLITHSRREHYANMIAFLSSYAPTQLIRLDYLIGNFPELSTIYPVSSDTLEMGDKATIPRLQAYFTNAGLPTFQYVKVHTGMILYFANLKLEILMTYEDHAPERITTANDTGTVTKWTITSTSAELGSVTADDIAASKHTTWMMLGDACIYQSRWLCAMWGGRYNTDTALYDGGYLKADMVQLAHHGDMGCEIALYKTIQPAIVWFPNDADSYNAYTQDSSDTWACYVDTYVVKKLPSVKYIVISGMYATKSTDSITVGFDPNGIYFPADSAPAWGIKYDANTNTYTTQKISYNSKQYAWHSITRAYSSPVIKK